MKYLIAVTLFIAGCSPGNNDLETKLLIKKNSWQDSLDLVKKRARDYAFRRIYDSAQIQLDAITFYESKIKAATFTLDSLSQLK